MVSGRKCVVCLTTPGKAEAKPSIRVSGVLEARIKGLPLPYGEEPAVLRDNKGCDFKIVTL